MFTAISPEYSNSVWHKVRTQWIFIKWKKKKNEWVGKGRNGCSLLIYGHLNLHCLSSDLSTWEAGAMTCQCFVRCQFDNDDKVEGCLSYCFLSIILPLTEYYGSVLALQNDVVWKKILNKCLNQWQTMKFEIINQGILCPNMYIFELCLKV